MHTSKKDMKTFSDSAVYTDGLGRMHKMFPETLNRTKVTIIPIQGQS